MSEAPQARPPAAGGKGKSGGAGDFLKRPLGPFPAWVWLAVVGSLVAWRLIASRSSAASSSTSGGTAGAGAASSVDTTGTYAGSFDASQVPQFINQTYSNTTVRPSPTTVNVTPPPAPVIVPHPAPAPPPSPHTTTNPAHPIAEFTGPTGVKVSNVSKNGATITWQTTATSGVYPTSYTVALYNAKGTRLYEGTVSTPDDRGGRGTVTIPGLPANTLIHGNVWPNGGQHAPSGANLSFHTTAK